MELVVGKAYYLQGMEEEMWDAPHPIYGAPKKVAARYLGTLVGNRRWHGFEVWLEGREEGVLFMNDADLKKLSVSPI